MNTDLEIESLSRSETPSKLPSPDTTSALLPSNVVTTTSITGTNYTLLQDSCDKFQMQFCDACNTSCVFMNGGHRRKLQVRYEGYVLVKKVSTASCFMRSYLPYATAQHSTINRRHSINDVLDDSHHTVETEHAVEHEPGCITSSTTPATSTTTITAASTTVSTSRTRAESTTNHQQDLLRRYATVDGVLQHQKQHVLHPNKLSNLEVAGELAKTEHATVVSALISDQTFSSPPVPILAISNNGSINLVSTPIESSECTSRQRRKSRTHQRLCRKKSKSQENLSRKRVHSNTDDGTTILNNAIQPPPLNASSLSRSESSINNVHSISLGGGSGGACDSGRGVSTTDSLYVGVGEFAKMKRLLTRVSDEVGQIVFDLEGWNEQYLTLNESSLTLRNVSTLNV